MLYYDWHQQGIVGERGEKGETGERGATVSCDKHRVRCAPFMKLNCSHSQGTPGVSGVQGPTGTSGDIVGPAL